MRTLQQKLYDLLAGLLVVWLAVFYPAMCDYHGMLLFRTGKDARLSSLAAHAHEQLDAHPSSHGPGAVDHDHMGAPVHNATPLADAEGDPALPQRSNHHKPLASESATTGLLSILAPPAFTLPQLQIRVSFVLTAPAFHHQYQHPPPDQPPRLQVV